MSITTSQRLNGDVLQAALPQGAAFLAVGGLLESNEQKTLTPLETDDEHLQSAITAAASGFVDYAANRTAILQAAKAALAANQAYLGHGAIPSGTLTATQLSVIVRTLSDQIDALTRQIDALIRLTVGDLTGTT